MSTKQLRLVKIVALLAVFTAVAFGTASWKEKRDEEKLRISYTAFVDKVAAGEIARVRSEGDVLTASGRTGGRFIVYRPVDAELSKLLLSRHIEFIAAPPATPSHWFELGLLLLVMVPLFLIMKKLALFGRSKAKLSDRSNTNTFFADVAGAEEAKGDLQETVEFLKDPERFSRLGGKMPTGILLVGPPGTGKTLLARAVAGEAGVPFFSMSGSEFVEMYVGVGSSRVRDLFAQGQKAAPCIVFIDEIDAVGRKRDAGGNGANDERDQTLNQLLVEMDGFSTNAGIVVIAATNRPEVLDPALLRPGRFDRQVTVGVPDIRGREEVLRVHTREVPLSDEVDLRLVARGTPGFSGADLANLVNEAAILAAKCNKPAVEMVDLDLARDKVLMGAERKSMVLSEQMKLATAWHEAGHVMVAKLVPGCDPVHKVSIVPRGRALGVTVQIPEEDIYSYTKPMLLAHIKVLMGGRAAEDLVFDTTTTGAGNDLARATDVARKMVSEWGMSEAFGPVVFGSRESAAMDGSGPKGFSEGTAQEIDAEVRKLVTTAYDQVRQLLHDNMQAMKALTHELVAKETLSGAEIDAVLVSAPLVAAAGIASSA